MSTDLHLADLICPRCCYEVGNGHHDTSFEDGMTIVCHFSDERAEGDRDKRFGPKANAALAALNMYVSDVGRRLTVAQHSALMRRLEAVVETTLDEEKARSEWADAPPLIDASESNGEEGNGR
jgi:hypothetical protein